MRLLRREFVPFLLCLAVENGRDCCSLRACRPWNFTAPLEEMVGLQQEMTNVLVPQLEAITPGSGCYLNEVNFPI